MYIIDWLAENWPTLSTMLIIAVVLVVYLRKKLKDGQRDQLIAEVFAFVRAQAKEMAGDITRPDIAEIVGSFYDATLAETDLSKLITREFLIDIVWDLWEQHMKIEMAVQDKMRLKRR